jgi:hypothetical protein
MTYKKEMKHTLTLDKDFIQYCELNEINNIEKPRSFIKTHSNFFGELISCMLCTSTWVGFFLSIILGGLTSEVFEINRFLGIFLDGVFTAGSVWALNSIIEFFEEKR